MAGFKITKNETLWLIPPMTVALSLYCPGFIESIPSHLSQVADNDSLPTPSPVHVNSRLLVF